MSRGQQITEPIHPRALWAALLSYVLPGLGQMAQGRIGKGLLFCICLNGLFLYGMALGQWKNVYLPDVSRIQTATNLPAPVAAVWQRLQFAGQVWIGAAAWPAIWQYLNYDADHEPESFIGKFQRTPTDEELNTLQRNSDKTWDLGWVYTVIAGVLNILVIYDAFAGPAMHHAEQHQEQNEEDTKS